MAGIFDTGTSSVPFMDSSGGASATGAISGAASLGIGAATGNPIAIMGGIASLAGAGLSFFGADKQAQVQKEEATVSADIAHQEELINKKRQDLATITYQRQSQENFRKIQLAQHTARAAATNQGALQGSGFAGGQGQIASQGAFNELSLTQDYKIGQDIFGLTSSIDADKMKLASLGGSAASYAGISALGSSLASAGPAITRISGGFGLPNSGIGTQQG